MRTLAGPYMLRTLKSGCSKRNLSAQYISSLKQQRREQARSAHCAVQLQSTSFLLTPPVLLDLMMSQDHQTALDVEEQHAEQQQLTPIAHSFTLILVTSPETEGGAATGTGIVITMPAEARYFNPKELLQMACTKLQWEAE